MIIKKTKAIRRISFFLTASFHCWISKSVSFPRLAMPVLKKKKKRINEMTVKVGMHGKL